MIFSVKNIKHLFGLASALVLFLSPLVGVNAQIVTVAQTVNNYTIAQKSLLVITTFEFANTLTQNNLDKDSVMNIARDITGMPFLLPYYETFVGGRPTAITNLINGGRINEAKRLLTHTNGAMRTQHLLEISLWYLHQDGSSQQDLDSATLYNKLALNASIVAGSSNWVNECIFQSAELEFQKGNIEHSRSIYKELVGRSLQRGTNAITARAYMRLGDLALPNDTAREKFYYQSLEIYRQSGSKEKQIEILWKISFCHVHGDFLLAEKDLREIMTLENQIGFKHKLFAQNRLSYILYNTGDYLGAVEYSRAALENLQWSQLSQVEGAFYIRIGIAYQSLGKLDESIYWLNRALKVATKKSHLFWYKSLLFLTGIICLEKRDPAEALTILDSVGQIFPPITVWERLQVLATSGVFYELLKRPKLADNSFRRLYKLATENPNVDPYGEMFGDYLYISQLFVMRKDLKMARIFLKLGMAEERKNAEAAHLKYSLYYKMDSLEGKYLSALQNHIKYKYFFDSATSTTQRKKLDELIVKYAAAKKDQHIRLLKQQGEARRLKLRKNKQTRVVIIAGAISLFIIAGLLFSQFKLKQRTNAAITAKNLALQQLIKEKEWLLKEVHHRVKNNLHTILALLESQAASLSDDSLQAIQTTHHRIFAMSLIHQQLYQGEDIKTIDMSLYIPELIRYLKENFTNASQIHFHLQIGPLKFSVSQAIPIALICNEAVTNSMKYAFPDKRKGVITIALRQQRDQITLLIADSGIGINQSITTAEPESMGWKLMNELTKDISGKMYINGDEGTKIEIVFPADLLVDFDTAIPKNLNSANA